MKITEIWKNKMKEAILLTYKDGIDEESLDKYLDKKIVETLANNKYIAIFRDVYKREKFEHNLNDIYEIVKDNNLIIGANGAFSLSPITNQAHIIKVICNQLENRVIEKNLAIEYEKKGMLKEAKLHDNLQTKVKQDTNSIYGIMTQPGSFLFNTDSASFITNQARQIISEAMWSFEKFLSGNTQFSSFDEAILYYLHIIKSDKNYNKYKDYVSYYPSTVDVYKRILLQLSDINNYYSETMDISKSLFYWIKHLTSEEKLYLYYKNNLQEFIIKNPKVLNIFKSIIDNQEEFLNPYKVPESYLEKLELLLAILYEYVAVFHLTHDRVLKYQNNPRDTVILSDTDSVFISLSKTISIIKELTHSQTNDSVDFKLVNSLCYILSKYSDRIHEEYIKYCNGTFYIEKYKLYMKNEFYFKRLLLYVGVKKNYSGYVLLREGNIIPEKKRIAHTGIKLTSSKIPLAISSFQNDLIENLILKKDIINPVEILLAIEGMKKKITDSILNGDLSFGNIMRFSGFDAYKNEYSAPQFHIAELWNRLYPEYAILPGESLLVFDTIVNGEKDLQLIKDDKMRDIIKNRIFPEMWKGEVNLLRKYGIKNVGIAIDSDIIKTPDWLIPIINIDLMCKKHLQAVSDLLPSLGMSLTRLSSNDKRFSPLISF
jgi:hypothetical protein